MWPPEETAARLYNLANFGLIGSLIVGAASTVLVVWMGNVKEGYLTDRLGKAVIEAGSANERAAKAQTDLAKLQQATLPRNFDPKKIAAKLRAFRNIRIGVSSLSDFEPWHTAELIRSAVIGANWTNNSNSTGGGGDELSRPGVWIEVAPMGPDITGVREEVSVDVTTHKTTRRLLPNPPPIPQKVRDEEFAKLNAGATALADALNAEGVVAKLRPLTVNPSSPLMVQADSIHVFVSLKPMPGMPDDLRVIIPPATK